MNPAIFLDRDGVLIENRDDYVRSWADVVMYPAALQALAEFSSLPHRFVLITNQSVIGRGMVPLEIIERINQRLGAAIRAAGGRLDGVYMCPHAPEEGCACRKPLPGLILEAAEEMELDLASSVLIGDALTDLQAAQAAGVGRAVLVQTGRGAQQLKLPEAHQIASDGIYADLAAALRDLFGQA